MISLKKIVGVGILSMIACFGLQGGLQSVAEAAYENPFANIKYMDFKSDDEEKNYIDQKTTAVFSSTVMPKPAEYVSPKGWQRERWMLNNVPVEHFISEQVKSDRVVLFLHGGGYVFPLNDRYRDWGVNLAELAGHAELLVVDYRVTPKYKHPAALEDAVTAYEQILAKGYDPNKIIVMGDSAGGNLSAALLVALRDKKLPMPKLAVLISPWTSLSRELPSRVRNYQKDQVSGVKNKRLTPEVLDSSYGKGSKVTEPYLSPLYADLTGLPKMLIIAGSHELLLDDAVLFAQHAKNDGVDVTTNIYKGMSHDWTLVIPEVPETKLMFKDIAKFINKSM